MDGGSRIGRWKGRISVKDGNSCRLIKSQERVRVTLTKQEGDILEPEDEEADIPEPGDTRNESLWGQDRDVSGSQGEAGAGEMPRQGEYLPENCISASRTENDSNETTLMELLRWKCGNTTQKPVYVRALAEV
jgi:hypothetical protein